MGRKVLNVKDVIATAKSAIEKDRSLAVYTRKAFEDLLEVSVGLANKVGLNSSNSSIPPSQDPNRKKRRSIAKGRKRKPGGQKGHKGSRLKPVAKPNKIEEISIDLDSLPAGKYRRVGFESRQVIEMEVVVVVTEFRAEIVENGKGQQFMAEFPAGVTEPAQYGNTVKAESVYMSQFQLIPLKRVQAQFVDQMGIDISKGSIANFNALAARKLAWFDDWARRQLITSPTANADETGVNVGGKGHWLHSVSNEQVTLFHVDAKRGQEAMENMGILPYFRGILIHDHWKPYFNFDCEHSLCNAHHIRELERAFEQDGQEWAMHMINLLEKINAAVHEAGGALDPKKAKRFVVQYKKLLAAAEQECPADTSKRAQTKSRNLLCRMRDFETEVLRFMENAEVPFTNNRGENDIRMTKVQQKISGCFRSLKGARNFARTRSYLLTCQKNGINPAEALRLAFDGKRPEFASG